MRTDYINMVSKLSDEWDDKITYQPTAMGMSMLHWLTERCGGSARCKYTRFGDQLMNVLFLEGLVYGGYESGEKRWYLSPLGFATYVKYADSYFEKLDKARKIYYAELSAKRLGAA